jgi:hydroxymethylbilane synthase
MKTGFVIGSRGSKLARTQSDWVAERLRELVPGASVRIEIIKTTGDRILDAPLAKIGGKGLFTKELEVALLEGRIDMAVHSMKDLPTELPEGLEVGAVPPREDPGDALICNRWASLDALPEGATVGSSSLRRAAQLRAYRPDLKLVDLRGNVDTRLKRIADGDYDATILACAGLKRLGLADAIAQVIPTEIMVSAVGQGALAVEARANDEAMAEAFTQLSDPATVAETRAERACLSALGGGCQIPLGALARVTDGTLVMNAVVCGLDGQRIIHAHAEGSPEEAETLGWQIGEDLLRQGAAELVAEQL